MKNHKIAEHSAYKIYVCEFKFKQLKCPVTSGSKYDMLEHIKIHDPMTNEDKGGWKINKSTITGVNSEVSETPLHSANLQ